MHRLGVLSSGGASTVKLLPFSPETNASSGYILLCHQVNPIGLPRFHDFTKVTSPTCDPTP
jgi:hypothetical protein